VFSFQNVHPQQENVMHRDQLQKNRQAPVAGAIRSELQPNGSMPYLGAAVPVGLVGATLVAIYVLLLDLLGGHALGTPNALGSLVLRGESIPLGAPVSPGLVLGYTLLHGATFIVVAAAAVSAEFTLTRQGISLPVQLVSGVIGIFSGLQVVFVALTILLEISWAGQVGFERVVVSNAIAALGMSLTVYLRGEGRRAARVPVSVR
jgi:hypothetical protein